jgi:small subunit ribosomal protein S9
VAETLAKKAYTWGTGRRKTSVARVRLSEGSGKISVNGRSVEQYFSEEQDRNAVSAPLVLLDQIKGYDILANVQGGGHTGQAFAVRLGLARALSEIHPDKESTLRDAGYLTRDSRMKERKKYGQRGARRSFQFSKR